MIETAANERYVLSCILNNPDSYWTAASILEPSDFSIAPNMYVYASIKALLENNQDIDIVAISNSFPPNIRKSLDKETGDILRYLDALLQSPHSVKNLEHAANQIKIISVKKQLHVELGGLQKEVDKATVTNVNELIEMCDRKITEVGVENTIQLDDGQIGKGLEDLLKSNPEGRKVPLGFYYLDSLLGGGVGAGQLMVVVARPKVGKTALLWNWAVRLARGGYSVLYMDTEMRKEEQQFRALAMMTGIAEKKIKNGLCNSLEKKKVNEARKELDKLNLYHIYMPILSSEAVITTARKYKIQKGIQIVFFDYIKLPDSSDLRLGPEWMHLGDFTNVLKNKIAGKLEIPVVTAAQLNRLAVNAEDFDSDQIGGSDRILHLCNYLLALTRRKEGDNKKGNLSLKMAYARDCEDGIEFYLQFKKPVLQITELGVPSDIKDEYFVDSM